MGIAPFLSFHKPTMERDSRVASLSVSPPIAPIFEIHEMLTKQTINVIEFPPLCGTI